MNETQLIEKYFKINTRLYDLATKPLRSHGPDHHYRVCMNALKLADTLNLKVDKEVLIAASLLHDLAAYYPEKSGEKYHDFDHVLAEKELLKTDFPKDKIPRVLEVIAKHGSDFKFRDKKEAVEVSILRDADKLDVFGQLGIARIIMVRTLKGDTLQEIAKDFYTDGHLKRKFDSITFPEAKQTARKDYEYALEFFKILSKNLKTVTITEHSFPIIDSSRYDIIWLSENHGIKENYQAYRVIISFLIKKGYIRVAWELPEDNNIAYADGRFSSEQKLFRSWLEKLLKVGKLISVSYIDSRNYDSSQQMSEAVMANNIIACGKQGKTIVISGNFHSQKRAEKVNGETIIPAAGLVQQAGYRLFTIGLSYCDGSFYNFGVKRFNPDFSCYDNNNQPFGTWVKNTNLLADNDYWFCVGEAHAITPD